jgi:hypothetical protein
MRTRLTRLAQANIQAVMNGRHEKQHSSELQATISGRLETPAAALFAIA